ncbi:MAG: hypothetical protein JNL77_08120 [Nitrosomonas sp.]|nr:hypothetical protein [Nitrosomonas sp.]
MKKYRYCDDKDYKNYTFQALSSQFSDNQEFEAFYSSLKDSEIKDQFLRVGTLYFFFAKNGDWHVDDPNSNPVIDYFTNSFKLVAILAIIESLSNKKHVDFFEWLSEKDKSELFPIEDKSKLKNLYEEYKLDYGSIRRCKSFFANLSTETQKKLCKLISIDGKPVTIQRVAEMIYKERSKFAHECDFVLGISSGFHVAQEKNKEIFWKQFSMKILQNAFEEGVIIYFKKTASIVHPNPIDSNQNSFQNIPDK